MYSTHNFLCKHYADHYNSDICRSFGSEKLHLSLDSDWEIRRSKKVSRQPPVRVYFSICEAFGMGRNYGVYIKRYWLYHCSPTLLWYLQSQLLLQENIRFHFCELCFYILFRELFPGEFIGFTFSLVWILQLSRFPNADSLVMALLSFRVCLFIYVVIFFLVFFYMFLFFRFLLLAMNAHIQLVDPSNNF